GLAPRELEGGYEAGSSAFEDADVGIVGCSTNLSGPVARRVVHEDDLEVVVRLREDARERRAERVLGVARGEEDGRRDYGESLRFSRGVRGRSLPLRR